MIEKTSLFTPGPLNTSLKVKSSMSEDLGSRTQYIKELTRKIHTDLEDIAECGPEFVSILLQGSGTYATEAMLTTLIDHEHNVLVVSNGIYGNRIAKICYIHGIIHYVLEQDVTKPIQIHDVEVFLKKHQNITHIVAVQFETAVGILNDIHGLLTLAERYNCEVLVDAMSSFGAIPLNYRSISLTAVVSCANKCLHGVPGIGFVVVRQNKLLQASSRRTLTLDLQSQWLEFEKSGFWRFTPPTHVLLAFNKAIDEYKLAGGLQARYKKYVILNTQLIAGLELLGIHPAIPVEYRAPMITTFLLTTQQINFQQLYDALFLRGLVIYPGSFIPEKSFRIGCIGEIDSEEINKLILAIKTILQQDQYE